MVCRQYQGVPPGSYLAYRHSGGMLINQNLTRLGMTEHKVRPISISYGVHTPGDTIVLYGLDMLHHLRIDRYEPRRTETRPSFSAVVTDDILR